MHSSFQFSNYILLLNLIADDFIELLNAEFKIQFRVRYHTVGAKSRIPPAFDLLIKRLNQLLNEVVVLFNRCDFLIVMQA